MQVNKIRRVTNRSLAGLDEAILGSMNSCGDPEQDSKKIADLLKYGAHSLVSRLLFVVTSEIEKILIHACYTCVLMRRCELLLKVSYWFVLLSKEKDLTHVYLGVRRWERKKKPSRRKRPLLRRTLTRSWRAGVRSARLAAARATPSPPPLSPPMRFCPGRAH